jgi:hypothetical protein
MMLRRLRAYLLSVLAVVLLTTGGPVPYAAAHELEENNGVSAVLHIAPDDNPYARQETFFNFDFVSKAAGFDVRYCACKASVQTESGRLQTASVISSNDSATAGHAVLTFPEAGVYKVNVRGFTSAELRQRFELTYTVRVAAAVNQTDTARARAASWQVILLSLTSLILLTVVASEMIRRGGRYRKSH